MARQTVTFHDERTGKFRKPHRYEKNKHFKVDTLSKGLANFQFKTSGYMGEKAADFAAELVEYAKANAPWSDQTGSARAGLESDVTVEDELIHIDLYHTVEYGLYLEVRWGAKYAIIIPTVEQKGSEFFDRLDGMLGEIVYYND